MMVIVYCYVTSPSRSSFHSSGTQAAVAKLPSSSEKRGMGSSSFPHFLLLGAGAEESLFCATHIANYFGTQVNKGGAIIFSVEADRTMGNVLFGILGGLPLLTLVWLASKLLRGLLRVFCWGTKDILRRARPDTLMLGLPSCPTQDILRRSPGLGMAVGSGVPTTSGWRPGSGLAPTRTGAGEAGSRRSTWTYWPMQSSLEKTRSACSGGSAA